ncbi:PREDICTED: cation/calcium exchanger 1-like [Brassica oleracea var. oleracea]|uniref:Sodium/calcium exchanger membrane region domain-containing protein n=1 Tax=Brassica oleracea var. oleracea TaxID=109376 RepID=A0A0D3AJM1_BRAOL|nr:PREDICTED: cation/calcium exchanger 1-like [Brassica oleracea var. oleracea]
MASLFSSPLSPRSLSLIINLFFIFLIYLHFASPNPPPHSGSIKSLDSLAGGGSDSCSEGLAALDDHRSKCTYVISQSKCTPQGYIDYLKIFFCIFGQSPVLGHLVLSLWLFVLFYLLGDTAASYFCPSLDKLSKVLKLSPTMAGVTLLSLGNGAPDLFSSVVSFTKSNNGDFGLNSVLGGVFFVSSFVVGTICLLIGSRDVSIDKYSFIRDVAFLLVALCCLGLIVFIGRITIWVALCYLSIYILYVGFLSVSHFLDRKKPISDQVLRTREDLAEMGVPLLSYIGEEKPIPPQRVTQESRTQEQEYDILVLDLPKKQRSCFSVLVSIVGLPLYLPRRLTIPVVCEEKWSRPCAVVSTAIAPVLLTELYCSHYNGSKRNLIMYIISGLIGLFFGIVAFLTTESSRPPTKFSLVWLLGGFTMSVTWTYIIAQELVSLLISLGNIFGISPSVLGLTVLAWGNSVGDLIANVTVAVHGGNDGAQIALSGCYAGPLFNTVIGLGVPLVISSLAEYPGVYIIPSDSMLLETLGFLMVGLLWALVIMPKKKMRLDRLVGGGLLAIYLCFLFLRMARVFGVLNIDR